MCVCEQIERDIERGAIPSAKREQMSRIKTSPVQIQQREVSEIAHGNKCLGSLM